MFIRQFEFCMEDSALHLDCAIKNLRLLQDEICREISAMKKTDIFLVTGHMEECCDAMFSTLRELERIQSEMDSAIEVLYKKEV